MKTSLIKNLFGQMGPQEIFQKFKNHLKLVKKDAYITHLKVKHI